MSGRIMGRRGISSEGDGKRIREEGTLGKREGKSWIGERNFLTSG